MPGFARFIKTVRRFTLISYLLWAVMPQFSFYRHAHADEGASHAHAALPAGDVTPTTNYARSSAADFYAGETAEHEAILGFLNASVASPARQARRPAGAAGLAENMGRHVHQDSQNNVPAIFHLALLPGFSARPIPAATADASPIFRPSSSCHLRGPPAVS